MPENSNETIGSGVAREIMDDGGIAIADARCRYSFRRIRAGVMEVRMVGTDAGQFGTTVLDEVSLAFAREGSLKLFLDASEGSSMAVDVSSALARFFHLNRERLQRVIVLASSKPMALAIGFIRHVSHTGDLIQLHSSRETYEARKASLV